MKNKHPIRATLSDDVRVESTELSSEGAVLRRVYLKADVLTQDLLSNQTQVPGAGSMLVEDHRPRSRQAIPEERDAQGPEAMAGQNRGTTAFDWKKELSYEQSQRLATMRGDVVIRHVPDENEQGQAFRIEAQRVRAELEPPENPAAAAATGPAASAPAASRPVESPVGEMRVRKIIADDRVHVEAQRGAAAQAGGRIQIDADQIEYTPESAELIARGSAAQPVLISDDQGQWEGSIQEVHWNARTGHINITKGRARVR